MMFQHSKIVNNCEACCITLCEKTAHFRWCTDEGRGDKGWPHEKKMKLILSLLLILLVSLGLTCGVMLHLQHKQQNNMNLQSPSRMNIPVLPVIQNPYDPERSEMDDRTVLQDAQTRFIPIDSPYIKYKDKRSILEDAWNTYQGNATSDLVIWEVQDPNVKDGETTFSIASQDDNVEDNLPNKYKNQGDPTVGEFTDDEYDDGPAVGEGNNNVIVNYPDDEQETMYDEENTESREDNLMYELQQNSEWEPTQERTESSDTKMNEQEEKGSIIEEEEPSLTLQQSKATGDSGDFHAFWKGEGNRHTIRLAQANMMKSFMDESIDPCEDFYQYACGNWESKNPIPKDKAGFDTFEMLRENLDLVLRELLEKPVTEQQNSLALLQWKDDAKVKAQHLYQSCMNYEILEQRGSQPLLDLLDKLGGWPMLDPEWDGSKFDWLDLMSQLRLYNNDILISEWVGPDIKNSDEYVIQFDQTSLGLPTRDYYLQPSNLGYLEAYKKYMITVATLLGANNVTQEAEDVIEFEKKLAKITSAPDERRNVSELYVRMTLGQLRQMVPQIDWYRYLSIVLARPCEASEPVVVFALNYMQDLVTLLENSEPRTIANYLLWRFVRHRVSNLDDRFQDAKQEFYFKLFGREKAPPRWKNCVAQVNSNMGMAVGAMFVSKYFDENSKNDTLKMTEEIMQSFRELIRENNWIDKETKELAIDKVDAMMLRIGYPDFILDDELLDERYRDVDIQPDKYFENTLNILRHLTRMEQDRLGTPVNKTLWNTAPAVVNAYYSRNKNQIMFPAGILQPPFYHRYFPRSLNYGGIGVVIGHEITHGFDDKGRLFDKYGNLHRWWHDEAIDGFHKRAQCLIDQYSHYMVDEVQMKVDGVSTQGENIADNGGIKQSFRAYQRWLDENGNMGETLPGVNATGHQLFFLNFAQVWCGTIRPEAMKNKLKTAVHSPGKFRVIGTLSNSEDFASVFGCPAGSPMNPVSKCSVW